MLDSLQHIQKLNENLNEFSNHVEGHIYLIEGIALGLFYGIIGNILVSHYYGVFEGLSISKFDGLFWSNLIILVVTLVLILVVSVKWHSRLMHMKSSQKSVQEMMRIHEEWRKEATSDLELLRKVKEKIAEKRKKESS